MKSSSTATVQVHLKDADIKVFTRRGNDWTKRFRKIANDAWRGPQSANALRAWRFCCLQMPRLNLACHQR